MTSAVRDSYRVVASEDIMKSRVFLSFVSVAAIVSLGRTARADLTFVDQGPDELGQSNTTDYWTNYLRVTDFNGDGSLDIVAVNCSGFFSNPAGQPQAFWANDGQGNFTPSSAIDFNGAVRQMAFGDVDNDGDLDVYVPAAGTEQGDAIFIQNAGAFANEAALRLPSGLSSDAGATRLGDLDNDGDLDIVVANGYIGDNSPPGALYLNDGTGVFAVGGSVPTAKAGVNPDDVDLLDADGDFDLDIYINFHSGQNSLWLNDGAATFTDASSNLPPLGSGSQFHYGPAVCDVDGDGDRDILIDNTGGGYTEQLLINDGAGNFTDETSARITGNSGADDNLVACLDFDGDGDLDFVVGSLSSESERLFQNDGTGKFAPVANAFSPTGDPTLWLEVGDLNGDGRLDAVTGQGEGQPERERVYIGNDLTPVDVLPPRTLPEGVTLSASADTVVRFAVQDNAVTDEGARLRRAFVLVGGRQIPARYMGGDLYRAVVPATPETSFVACAEDWQGNIAAECGGSASNSSSSTGAGGAGGGEGGGAPSGSASGGNGSGAGATSGAGGSGSDGDSGDDGGCGCRLVGGSVRGHTSALALFAVGVLALGLGRRAGGRRRPGV